MSEACIFYTYIYCNPLKPGRFTYTDLNMSFLYEPFYVGKGKLNRYLDHISECKPGLKLSRYANMHKIRTLRKIIYESNLKPFIIKLFESADETKAFENENRIINIIGRRDLNTGSLTNLTSGGSGGSGYIWTDELRAKQRQINLGAGNPWYGRTHSDETKTKMSKSRSKLYETDPTYKDKLSKAGSGSVVSDEGKKNMSIAQLKSYANNPNLRKLVGDSKRGVKPSKETIEKMKIANRGANNGMFGKHHSNKTKELISSKAKERARKNSQIYIIINQTNKIFELKRIDFNKMSKKYDLNLFKMIPYRNKGKIPPPIRNRCDRYKLTGCFIYTKKYFDNELKKDYSGYTNG